MKMKLMRNNKLRGKIIEMYGSQADFASILVVHEVFVSRVVNERIELSDETKQKWAELLNCEIEEIFL